MRKIIFRGKRIYGSEWIEGVLLTDNKTVYDILYPEVQADGKLKFRHFEVDPDTIGQFTGLTDKNGKEIFEGDVVKCKEFENLGISILSTEESKIFTLDDYKGQCKTTYISQVFYNEAQFYVEEENFESPLCLFFGDMKNSQPIFEIEIIGNIHDNPELLTSK